MRRLKKRGRSRLPWWAALLVALLALPCGPASPSSPTRQKQLSGTLKDGALWRLRVPSRWNGTLILYSHGYIPQLRPPQLAPTDMEEWLLDHGYALAASSYARGGWAVAAAVPDQLATLTVFEARVGLPRRTIAWGESMGALVTVALAERATSRIDGALTACGSVAGSLGMMNMALDGAFAFSTLLAPHAGIRVVATQDDQANAQRVTQVMAHALTTPQGRARVALAGVLAGLPGWTQENSPQPAPGDDESQLEQMARSFVAGAFLPRAQMEQEALGVFSWNTGIDYRAQLERTGRRAWVERFYQRANLDLEADLEDINAAPRIVADARAVNYMRANYVPSGAPNVPILSYHTMGDGLTSPALQGEYARAITRNGEETLFRAAWIRGAGHCSFTASEHIAVLQALEERLQYGRWSTGPQQLNFRAARSRLGPGRFSPFTPPPFTRECLRAEQRCLGE